MGEPLLALGVWGVDGRVLCFRRASGVQVQNPEQTGRRKKIKEKRNKSEQGPEFVLQR